MSFALLGVMAMQLYFLRQSYLVQSDLFDRSVNDALNNVVSKLARQDALNFLSHRAQNHDHDGMAIGYQPYAIRENNNNILLKDTMPEHKRASARQRKLAVLRDSLKRMIMHKKIDDELDRLTQEAGSVNFQIKIEEYVDDLGEIQTRFTPQIVKSAPKKQTALHKYDTLVYTYTDPQFGKQLISEVRVNPLWEKRQTRMAKERQLNQIKKMLDDDSIQNVEAEKPSKIVKQPTEIQNLMDEYQKSGMPLAKRLSPIWIDSLLRFELHNKGIFLPFSYEVTTATNDSLIFSNAVDNGDVRPKFIDANSYQTPIFSKEVINDPGRIRVSFPQKNSLILNKMTATMATSGGLLFVIVICFSYTIFSILRQKKISEMKTDFINNMTHEFKTPVSTIMIASETLKDAEIAQDKTRVARLANIIYEENARLGSHIERVLNIARIEKNDFKLDISNVDVNEMITTVLDSMSLKLQKVNAHTTLNLEAAYAVIRADELHFSNVLYNLIDNAIKYSDGEPQITISTLNKNNQLILRVADKGIGMSRDQQTKIFDQFYRIPTGNLHDVKGFGLGLSYVNTIVRRLDGDISVKSEKDRGSEFELRFDFV